MNCEQTRSLRKIKHAVIIPAIAVAVVAPATRALGAPHTRDHARRTRITTHTHGRAHAHYFRTDGRKVG